MGWKKTCAMDERMRFVMAVEERDEAFAAVCRRFGVSRKTGYKWLERYGDGGAEISSTVRGHRCIIGER